MTTWAVAASIAQVDASDWAVPGVPHGDLLFALLLASVIGGAIGLERELSGKPAGFRTNLLICVGSALLTHVSMHIGLGAGGDPGRIAAQIVSGIGFLGAGTIIQSRGSVIGLTTAATLWVVAAIGIVIGAKAYLEAIGSGILVLSALYFLGKVEGALIRRRRERAVRLETDASPEAIANVDAIFDALGIEHRLVEVEKTGDSYRTYYELRGDPRMRQKAIRQLFDAPYVHRLTSE